MSTTNWIRAGVRLASPGGGAGEAKQEETRRRGGTTSPAAATAAAVATLGVDTYDLGTASAAPDGDELGAEGGARVPLVPDAPGPPDRTDGVGGTPESVPILTLRRCLVGLQPHARVDHLALLVLPGRALGVADPVLACPNPLSRILVVLDPSVMAEAICVRNGGRQHGAGLGRDSLRRDQHEADHGHAGEQRDESPQLATAPDGGGFHLGAHEDPPSTSALLQTNLILPQQSTYCPKRTLYRLPWQRFVMLRIQFVNDRPYSGNQLIIIL